ncbi:MAG: PAS domain S-box protein [Deltaproteobacteria bacterium]
MNQDSTQPVASTPQQDSSMANPSDLEMRLLRDQHRNLMNSVSLGIVNMDSDFHIIDANLAAQNILGLNIEELNIVPSGDPPVMSEDGAPFPLDKLPHRLAMSGKKEVRNVVVGVFNKYDQRYRWVLCNAVPVFHDGEMDPYQVICTFTDITRRKEAEQALRESQELFSLFMENVPVVVFIKNENSEIIFNNRYHRELIGYDSTGTGAMDVFDSETAASLIEHDRQALENGYWQGTELISNNTGETHIYDTIKFRIPRQGNTPLLGGIGHDISDRLKTEASLRASEQRYRLLFQNMPTAVIYHKAIRDRAGAITDMLCLDINEAFERLVGFPRAHIINRPLSELIPGYQDNLKAWLDLYEGIEKMSHTVHFEHYIKEYDIWLNISAYSLPDSCFVTMFQDITEMKNSVATIQQLNNELEHRVEERTAQLRAINKEIEAYSYTVSHDLRAPLRAISEFARILNEEYGAQLDEEGVRLLAIIKRNVNKMEQLIQDLLNFSLAMRSPGDKTLVDMNQLVEQTVGELLVAESGRKIEIQIETLPSVCGNSSMLKQVWCNLISNSLKFTSQNPQACIQVGYLNNDDKEIQYYVKDNGVGFDMKYAHRLFGVFKRLHRESDFSGSGVGLAIVKRIIDRHGGKVWVESQPGVGTTFYFSLPGK